MKAQQAYQSHFPLWSSFRGSLQWWVRFRSAPTNDDDFATKMQVLTERLGEQMAKGAELDLVIRQKMGRLGYEF